MITQYDKIRGPVLEGWAAVWPVCLGYMPLGAAFGVLAQQAGLTPLEIGLMSLCVFAGSAQFIAISMLSAGAAAAPIVLTTFVVNLRHLLMSSSLAVYLGNADRKKLSVMAYGIVDETFAVNLARFMNGPWGLKRCMVVNYTAWLVWVASTIAGGVGGRFVSADAFGIDYALIAMFICLLVFQLKGWLYILTALISGTLAVAIALKVPGNLYIVAATVAGATLGSIIRMIFRKLNRGSGAE